MFGGRSGGLSRSRPGQMVAAERQLNDADSRNLQDRFGSSSASRARDLAAGQLTSKLHGPIPAFHGCRRSAMSGLR